MLAHSTPSIALSAGTMVIAPLSIDSVIARVVSLVLQRGHGGAW